MESFRETLEKRGAIVTDAISEGKFSYGAFCRESALTYLACIDLDDSVESPSTYLWTLYFLASHYSSLAKHTLALETLSVAESHTPSLPELPMLRARILKRSGDLQAAANAMEEARDLDGQDRGLNCKSVKYLIRAGRIEEAETVAGLFTKVSLFHSFEVSLEIACSLRLSHTERCAFTVRRLG